MQLINNNCLTDNNNSIKLANILQFTVPIEMQSFPIWFIISLALFNHIEATSQCDESIRESKEATTLPHQNELEQILDAFDQNDVQKFNDELKFLKNEEFYEEDEENLGGENNRFSVSFN